jgi:adenosylcobyric acid synthase
VLAHLYGTVKIMDGKDQKHVKGFIINKFRGDQELLRPGLEQLTRLTGLPVFGVIPYSGAIWIDAEDSLATVADAQVGRPGLPFSSQWLQVAAIRLPRVSNTTDVEALACEPGVSVRWVSDPARVADADLVVLPGSKATVSDLKWLRDSGIATALTERARMGKPIFAICGGYQMLGQRIVDEVESGGGETAGLGLLDLEIEFAPGKVLRQVSGEASGFTVRGYEIHHGRVMRSAEEPLLRDARGEPEGAVRNAIWGTHWHGLLESDEFRRHLLMVVAKAGGRAGFVVAPDTSVAAVREAQLDVLADLIAQHVDVTALLAA